jgi:hypothetical protein
MGRAHNQEYPLPFHLNDLHFAEHLDHWLARFAERSADEVAEIFMSEWDAIKIPVVVSFRDAILEFHPISLFHTDEEWYDGWWLRMLRSEIETMPVSEVLLHAPPDRPTLIEYLTRDGLPELDVMSEFYWYFYKMQNGTTFDSGFYPLPWRRYQEGGWYEDVDKPNHPDPKREWADAFVLYCTSTGDEVLMKANGEVSWALLAEQRICPLAPSFSRFLKQCAICYRDWGHLDYYDWIERCSQE